MSGPFGVPLLAVLDFVPHIVLGLYLVVLLGLSVAGYLKSQTSEEDFYLAGRGQGFITTALTIMATFFSSAALLGIPGLVYRDGVGFVVFALNTVLGGAIIYLFGSRIRRIGQRRGYVTPADMVADYYGGSAAIRILVALAGFLYVVPYVVMQIRAGGYLAQRMFPDMPPVSFLGAELDVFGVGATLLSLVTMVYVLVGGMRSVAWSDVIQGTLLLAGMLLAGIATVLAMGGLDSFFEQVASLPTEAQSLPGATGSWPVWKIFTVVIFGSIGSMIQPGQWMRYYAARSTNTLRRSGLIFAVVLPVCFLFGVMILALGGRALYPPVMTADGLMPHPAVGSRSSEFDQILIVMIQEHVPALMGAAGVVLVSVIFVAIMAASMSTADSNLHALSAVLTRDVYDRFVRPQASERERAWVGRIVIVAATLLALWLVSAGESDPNFRPLELIGQMMLMAIAFASQLLPATLDMLYIRRGTKAGVVAGLVVGLGIVFLFTPFPGMMMGPAADGLTDTTATLNRMLDVGAMGFIVNAAVMIVVSAFTRRLDPAHVRVFARELTSGEPEPARPPHLSNEPTS